MSSYKIEDYGTYKIDDEGQRFLLANFDAKITQETRTYDGQSTETTLIVEGLGRNPDAKQHPFVFPPVEVPAAAFSGMNWVMNAWGVKAVMQPGAGVKEDLRTAIMLTSRPKTLTIYKALGWTEIAGKKAFIHAGGAITAKGNDATVTVRLPQELSRYNLVSDGTLEEGWKGAIELTRLTPRPLAWTLWTAIFAPIFGAVDFAIHLTGRSGTFKSELVSLYQSFYGKEMDARHLPGSWSSTGNALEAQAFYAQSCPFVIDDFVPVGTAWQVRAYQTTADKIIRAQGNQSGRARLTDTSGLQRTMYPRGIIISTGEDTPEGHSVRARMMINELSPGDILPAALTKAQKRRGSYPYVTAELIRDQCGGGPTWQAEADDIRNVHLKIGHTRTPPMIGRLIITGRMVLAWAVRRKLLKEAERKALQEEMEESIRAAGESQTRYLESADPVEIFFAGLRQLFGAGHAHLRSLNGGVPLKAGIVGWTSEQGVGEMATYKSRGPCVGWLDWQKNELYVEMNIGYMAVKKTLGADLSLTKQTLFKRMKDAGVLARTDDARQRNTVRITAEGHVRQVIAVTASEVLEEQADEDTDKDMSY